LLLEDVLHDLLARRSRGTLRLKGPAGSGKTTALEHLAHVFAGANILFFDEPEPNSVILSSSHWIVFTTSRLDGHFEGAATYRLAPWREDEWIEFLLAVHPHRCRSVMARLRSDNGVSALQGNPQLWRLALDQLAADEALPTTRSAILNCVEQSLPSRRLSELARDSCLDMMLGPCNGLVSADQLRDEGAEALLKLLRHHPIQLLLGADRVVGALLEKDDECLQHRFPHDLIEEIAIEAARQSAVIDILVGLFPKASECHAMAASILHAAKVKWSPKTGKLKLAGAYLGGAKWLGLSLPKTDFTDADLNHAVLRDANLDRARAVKADLSHADLSGAWLVKLIANEANLAHANLSGSNIRTGFFDGADLEKANLQGADLRRTSFATANLAGACFREADLRKACLTAATVDDADFSKADLCGAILSGLKLRLACFTNARFRGAQLVGCDLEGMELPRADFKNANLRDALLTGSTMPAACFDGACLAGAGLADVDWEEASLRDADLSGVSFHMGSSRCGLVASPIACEGSRTGFYTDDFTEQDFKAPEEIRKANLCHADLRGARIADVDFYLVDLRHARYDPEQKDHLRRCGAILHDRKRIAEE